MPTPQDLKAYYLDHRVPNPVNVTLTQKQCVDGEWLDDLRSEQNFRHFANKLNSRVLGARFKRFGKRLAMLVVRESDATHRHHLHCIIERPEHLSEPLFFFHVKSCWTSTRSFCTCWRALPRKNAARSPSAQRLRLLRQKRGGVCWV